MADFPDAAGDGTYRPLALLALAGFGVSCLFGIVVVASTLIAIAQGAAFFFPGWVLLIAVLGSVLSWCGLNEIRNSEGTKAGRKLAVCGLWISLVTGSGYFAYSYFTGVALAQQALAFFTQVDEGSGFFVHLQAAAKDKIALNRAFLLTRPAQERDVRADDDAKLIRKFDKPGFENSPGELSRFRTHILVQTMLQAGDKAVIEPIGVQEWSFEKHSYQVAYLFRLKTPEVVTDIILTARSTEAETEGQNRQWFVDMTKIRQPSFEMTDLGKGLKVLREHAIVPVQQLENSLRSKAAQLPDFDQLDVTDWTTFTPEHRQELKPRLRAIFAGADDSSLWHLNVMREKSSAGGERDAQGRLTLEVPLTVLLSASKGDVFAGVEALAVLRTRTTVEPEKIGAGDPGLKMPEWEFKHLKFIRYMQKKA